MGVRYCVKGPSGAGSKRACKVITQEVLSGCFQEKFELLVFQQRISYKSNTKQKGFFESEGSVYYVNFRESYLEGGRK